MQAYIHDNRDYIQQNLCGLVYCEEHAPKEAEKLHPLDALNMHRAMDVAPGTPISCCCCDTVVVEDTRK